MSHTWMSHVAHMNESCHTCEWVMSHTWMNESCHTHEWVMSHIWIRHATPMKGSCHAYRWFMSHIWMRDTHMHTSDSSIHVWHDSFKYTTQRIYIYMTWLINMWDLTLLRDTNKCNTDTIICGTWLLHVHVTTHPYIHDMTHSYMRLDSPAWHKHV